MAVTKLADIYEPAPFNNSVAQNALEMNAFIASGVMVNDPAIANLATVGGRIGELPSWIPLVTTEPNYSSDDDTSDAATEKVESESEKYRRVMMNKGWSVMDFTQELAGNVSDPLGAVTGRVGGYWATQTEKRVIQSAMGVLADNVANDSGDMVSTIGTDAVGASAAGERISASAVITAAQTLGDHKFDLQAIAMHSVQHALIQDQGLVVDNFDPQTGTLRYQTFLGYRVIIDDSLPAVAGTNRIMYTSILFGAGAFGYGAGSPETPSAIDRKEESGDGGGQTSIWTRRTDIIHPRGLSFLSASIAGPSATLAELADATEWDRIYDRKNIQLAYLQTNA